MKKLIQKAARIIKGGGLVAFPTETVYGLGANALDANAVKKIFLAKGRPSDNPLIVHIAENKELMLIAKNVSTEAKALMKAFWPGPLTLIVEKKKNVPDEVSAGLPTVAVRMPDHPVALALIKAVGLPIAAPSANLAGKPSPTSAQHVAEDLVEKIDLILDGGSSKIGLESTVVDASGDKILILRSGAVTADALQKVLGYQPKIATLKKGQKAKSPGMKYRHYAPKARLFLIKNKSQQKMIASLQQKIKTLQKDGHKVGVLCSEENKKFYAKAEKVVACGSMHDLPEVAKNLFACLRKFDTMQVDSILVESFGEKGIGKAVMERLKKASSG
jgi:L-threonylcarbamoyladenylate synthase